MKMQAYIAIYNFNQKQHYCN